MTCNDMCPVCPRRHAAGNVPARTIHGARIQFAKPTGPALAAVMFVVDCPDVNANRVGITLVGKVGREFDDCYLPAAQLHREDVYVTCAMKCQRADAEPPTPGEARQCAQHWLYREVAAVRPRVVVALGATAARVLLPDPDAARVDVDTHHGQLYGRITYTGSADHWLWAVEQPPVAGINGVHLVIVNPPSAGFAGSDLMTDVLGDFRALAQVLRALGEGRYPHVVDQYPYPTYAELTTYEDVSAALAPPHSATRGRWVAVDTETDGNTGPPWCLSFSTAPGTGYVIPADAPNALRAFQAWVTGQTYRRVLLHNALFDVRVLARMGVHGFAWRDTMHTAYQLGNQPQGLKPLAWRLAGMEMADYADVVQGPSVAPVLAWGERVLGAVSAAVPTKQPRQKLILEPIHKEWRKQALLLARRLTKLEWWHVGRVDAVAPREYAELIAGHKPSKRALNAAAPAAPVDFPNPWDWWDTREPAAAAALKMFGRGAMPSQSIVHVERTRAIQYAARDADATLRAWFALRNCVRELQRVVPAGGGKPHKTW